MKASWFRRATQAVACAGALTLLAACGSGSVVSDLEPKRFLTVGDSFMDVGQAGGTRYTVNDGTNNWVQELASHYSQPVTAVASTGTGTACSTAVSTVQRPSPLSLTWPEYSASSGS